MTKTLDVFCEIPCLTEQSMRFSGLALQKKWFKSADKRYIALYLQKFIEYNLKLFSFLGVTPHIIGSDQNAVLIFQTSGFIGSIPLRASDTGKQIGDFIVTPRFIGINRFEDYIEILNLLEADINPEVIDSLPLLSGANFRPPLYLEAVKFISSLEKLVLNHWHKFDNVKKLSNELVGQINWDKYIRNEYKAESRLKFPTSKNVLSEFHDEYSKMRYVFNICQHELLSANTPPRIKGLVRNKLIFLEEKLYYHKPKETSRMIVHFGDSPIVIQTKEQANKILTFNLIDGTAWRVDYSNVFEKFIQFLFKELSKEIGGHLYSNLKFHSRTSKYYSWELRHLEPDVIYQKGKALLFIDAKYKSNLYNRYGISEMLKEEHRRDLHQILAYNSFSATESKFGCLCYPSNKVEMKRISYKNAINEVVNTVFILGVPLKKDSINEIKQLLVELISEITREEFIY